MRRLLVAAALLLAACGGVAGQPAATPSAITGTLQVFAASSLTAAFQEMGPAFVALHPSVDVKFNFAGSPTLVTQIEQGGPADVFASADQTNMQHLQTAGLADGTPKVFASNLLQIVVQAGNPKGVTGLADLAKPSVVTVVCAPQVPCGAYATQAFSKAGVTVSPKSQEQDVKSVVSRVSLGEADAGIVYTTDVKAGGPKVQGVTIPADQNVLAQYPITAIKDDANSAAAKSFVQYVLSSAGQKILAKYGFGKP